MEWQGLRLVTKRGPKAGQWRALINLAAEKGSCQRGHFSTTTWSNKRPLNKGSTEQLEGGYVRSGRGQTRLPGSTLGKLPLPGGIH
jgi:hypothetical protein